MKSFWYRRNTKWISDMLQGLLAGLLVLCLVGVNRLMEGDLSLSELSRNFENTHAFYQIVEADIREKISCDQNRELFERGGNFDGSRQIDIRQYVSGAMDEANANANTTYLIEDLLQFANDGASLLAEEISDMLSSGLSEPEAGLRLMDEASKWETILPVSGMSLLDLARISSNPPIALLEYYRSLTETSLDIQKRYKEYEKYEEDKSSSHAPSNIAYYVENTATRRYYTNLGVTSMVAADNAISADRDLTWLFEGERRFNIMVANTEHVYSDYASEWFMQASFLGSGEKVAIAINMDYPIGDDLQKSNLVFERREPKLLRYAVTGGACLILLVALFLISAAVTGRVRKDGSVRLYLFDQVPAEIASGICVIAAISWWMLANRYVRLHSRIPLIASFGKPCVVAVEYEILLFGFLSLVRRLATGTIWSNSVIYYVVQGTKQVYSARKSSRRLLLLYLVYVIVNMVSLLVGGIPGAVVALILNVAALLYLMRNVVGNQNVREGLQQISEGKLDYRINTQVLTGESREMGEAVNEMGEGLQEAVDAMLRGERLKAELITNVSHDLKTPLTSIINYVDLLKRRNLTDPKAAEYVQVLDQKTQRLKQLTEDLIEASKISSGNVELHPDRLQLQQFIRQACGEYEDRLEEKDLTIILSMPKEPIEIWADGARLWRIFENLLGNIGKYAKSGTKVDLFVVRDDEMARICFQNEPAVPITVSSQQLMERFSRGDSSRGSEGFGLGLSITDSLTRLMGGNFEIETREDRFQAIVSFPILTSLTTVTGTEEPETGAGKDTAADAGTEVWPDIGSDAGADIKTDAFADTGAGTGV